MGRGKGVEWDGKGRGGEGKGREEGEFLASGPHRLSYATGYASKPMT